MSCTTKRMLALVVGLMSLASGCHTGFNGFPNLSTLNNPTRVPSPPLGSYAAPGGYAAPANGGPTSFNSLRPVDTTLGQLRSMESGEPNSGPFGSEGRIPSSEFSERTIAARPVVAPPIRPKVALANSTGNQSNQALQAAAASFAQASAPPVVTASSLAERGTELPDPRSGLNPHRAEISDGISWKTVQR